MSQAAGGDGNARQINTTVLVTGANGMVGRCVLDCIFGQSRDAAKQDATSAGRRWIFVTSNDADLRDRAAVDALFEKHMPTHVLHCAARLASAADMTSRPVDFWMDNVLMNNNVLASAHRYGVHKLVSVLSTVMISKDAAFPVSGTCEELLGGQLHEVSQSYGLAKRALAHLSQWYRKQHGCRFSCILPSNIFGPYGQFDTSAAPLLNALIAKAEASRVARHPMTVMGTGAPMRQMLYAKDLARILTWALDEFDDDLPLIVAGEEVSVRDLADMARAAVAVQPKMVPGQDQATAAEEGEVCFDASFPDGPLRRTADTSRFAELFPTFAPTPLRQAIADTAIWYKTARSEVEG